MLHRAEGVSDISLWITYDAQTVIWSTVNMKTLISSFNIKLLETKYSQTYGFNK